MGKSEDSFSKEQIQQGLANRGGQHDTPNLDPAPPGVTPPGVVKRAGSAGGMQGFPKRVGKSSSVVSPISTQVSDDIEQEAKQQPEPPQQNAPQQPHPQQPHPQHPQQQQAIATPPTPQQTQQSQQHNTAQTQQQNIQQADDYSTISANTTTTNSSFKTAQTHHSAPKPVGPKPTTTGAAAISPPLPMSFARGENTASSDSPNVGVAFLATHF